MASYNRNYRGCGSGGSNSGVFQFDNNGYCIVYTDGCCRNNGQDYEAKAGIGVFFGYNHPLNISEPLSGGCRPTNQNAEIQAASVALEELKQQGITKVLLKTDSHFLVESVNNYMGYWLANNWRNRNGSFVKNRAEFEKLNNASRGMLVCYEHVRSHSGIPENEEADRLAREGAKRYKYSQ